MPCVYCHLSGPVWHVSDLEHAICSIDYFDHNVNFLLSHLLTAFYISARHSLLSVADAFAVRSFQENLLKTMMQIEETFHDLASSSSNNCLIICDRGELK